MIKNAPLDPDILDIIYALFVLWGWCDIVANVRFTLLCELALNTDAFEICQTLSGFLRIHTWSANTAFANTLFIYICRYGGHPSRLDEYVRTSYRLAVPTL